MSLKEQLKAEAKQEKQKLSAMSTQDKLWYIWEYYKLHIGGLLIAILLLYVIGTTVYRSTFHTELYCMVLNQRSQDLNTAPLESDFHDYMNFTNKQTIFVESQYITYGDNVNELTYAAMSKVSALMAAKELDMIIADPENIDYYTAMDGLVHLEESLPEDLLSRLKDRLYYAPESSGQSVAVAVDIAGTQFAEDMNLTPESSFLCLIVNSSNIDNGVALLQYIFQ